MRQGHAQGKVPHHLGLAGGGGCIFRIEWRPPSRDCSQKAKVQLTYLYVTEFCVPDLQRVRSLQIEAPVPNMTRPALLEVSASPAMAPGSTAMAPHKRYPEKGKFLHCINGEVHPLLRPRPSPSSAWAQKYTPSSSHIRASICRLFEEPTRLCAGGGTGSLQEAVQGLPADAAAATAGNAMTALPSPS